MTCFRLYYDKDKEEAWLNKMAQKGFALRKYFLGVYYFDDCEPGEYYYQVDMLNNWSGDKEDYSAFMEETGIEIVCQWYRWVILRKKAVNGPFELYTDNQSKIEHYTRIKGLMVVGLVVELICLAMEVLAFIATGEVLPFILMLTILALVVVFIGAVLSYSKKINELK